MSHPDSEIGSPPQCGFGADIDFDTLIKANRFLFRVYTPKERSPFEDDTEPFFVAPRFDEQVARSPVEIPKIRFSETVIGSYAEVARHMEWTTRTSSSYISTSFSFSWSIWEAVRRYHQGVKKDVEIAVIDATALGGRAATAIQLLQKSSLAERNEQFWKWHRFSQDSQSVLVYGMIPRTAVLASIPLLQILRKMPSYFLRSDIQTIYGNPLDQVAWNYRLRKQNYRQFCRDMSNFFLDRPAEVQVRDSTAGAVRLALAFLRPFFHQAVQDNFDKAISYLCALAITISEWPGDSWGVNHPEIRKVVDTMVLALGEELREKYSLQRQEITRLQLVVDGLEQTLKLHNNDSTLVYLVDDDEDDDEDESDEGDDEPTLVVAEVDWALHKSNELQSSPLSPAAFRTPITPPESRRNSLLMATTTIASINAMSSPLTFIPVSEDSQIGPVPEAQSSKISPLSESPASPPLTPTSRSPIFKLSVLPVQEVMETVPLEDPTDDPRDESIAEDSADNKQYISEDMQDDDKDSIQSEKLQEFPTAPDEDEGDETEHEADVDHEAYVPPSPTDSWIRVRPHLSSFSSQSSIGSIETLCEPVEFPSKRLSLASTDSYEFIPPFSSFRSFGLASRTVSFSEPSPRLPLSPVMDAVDPLDIPLPPSPEIPLSSISESSSISKSSSSDSSSSTVSSLPESQDIPLESLPTRSAWPRAPILPLESSSSSSSSSLASQSSSAASSPTPALPLELPLPVEATALLIPPKRQISLLSPLTESNASEEDDDTSSLRSVSFTDNASYLVTGFLVGAFITLLLFSTRRRELLVLT